jgi:hypothetical protein
MRTPHTASYAGLTRVSITLREKSLAKWMDCRVKPGNDELEAIVPCPGRDAALFALLRRTGTPVLLKKAEPRLCSAPLRKCYALRCVRGTRGSFCLRSSNLLSIVLRSFPRKP